MSWWSENWDKLLTVAAGAAMGFAASLIAVKADIAKLDTRVSIVEDRLKGTSDNEIQRKIGAVLRDIENAEQSIASIKTSLSTVEDQSDALKRAADGLSLDDLERATGIAKDLANLPRGDCTWTKWESRFPLKTKLECPKGAFLRAVEYQHKAHVKWYEEQLRAECCSLDL